MSYRLFFPHPVKHVGLFQARSEVIEHFQHTESSHNLWVFRNELPTAKDVWQYANLLAKDNLSKSYFGELALDSDSWKWTASLSDLDNIYKGLTQVVNDDLKNAYFMTNSGGHHSNNQKYELFCPLNQLFFAIETLNYQDNFPTISWLDFDAHFGNGDKTLWDIYQQKMISESNNVTGISLHNDFGNISEVGYEGVGYEDTILETDYLNLVRSNLSKLSKSKYLLAFIGTDIFKDDYGGNKNISQDVLPQMLKMISETASAHGATLIIFQTGGTKAENIKLLTDESAKMFSS